MKAFVKTNRGTFPNVNFFLAWEAFNTMGYSVTCFEEQDIDTLDITPETPVFAGVTVFRKVIDKMGVNYAPFDCYPKFIEFNGQNFYGRNIKRSTLGVEKARFHKDGVPVFVKPVLPKQFIGHVWNSIINLIPLAKIPDDAEVWVCEPINIISEVRVYVHDGEILGVKHYWGDWSIVPDKMVVEEVIKRYVDCPIAYGIDFAVIGEDYGNYKTIVMEVNDGCNLGNYGLDSIHYGEMIVSRWFEIMEKGGKGKELRTNSMKEEVNEMRRRLFLSLLMVICWFFSGYHLLNNKAVDQIAKDGGTFFQSVNTVTSVPKTRGHIPIPY